MMPIIPTHNTKEPVLGKQKQVRVELDKTKEALTQLIAIVEELEIQFASVLNLPKKEEIIASTPASNSDSLVSLAKEIRNIHVSIFEQVYLIQNIFQRLEL